jgi:hypothetical protein
LILTGALTYTILSPFRTVAGIAAACTGDWSAAEHHHQTAIQQTDSAPYRHLQPVAREWYAKMLLDRSPPDAVRAKELLTEAIAMCEATGMPFRASGAREMLAAL